METEVEKNYFGLFKLLKNMPVRTSRRSDRVEGSPKIEKSTDHKQEEIALTALDYVNKKRSISLLEKDVKKLRPTLETYMDKHEVELPTGAKECIIPYVDVDIHLKRGVRNSARLRDDALTVIAELGIADEVVEMKPVINEEELQAMISAGEISEVDALRIYEHKTTYAFSVDTSDKFDGTDE